MLLYSNLNTMPLTPTQRRSLKARAHNLSPVVMIGNNGLTAAVLKEIEINLKSHELIKIHAAADERAERDAMMNAICEAAQAEPVQAIGKMLIVYRERPESEAKPTPAKKRPTQKRKPPRPLKRSFQNEK